MFKKVFKFGFLFILLVVVLSGCTFPWEKARTNTVDNNANVQSEVASNEGSPVNTNEIKKFKDEAELKQFLQNNASSGGMTIDRVFSEGMTSGLKNMAAPMADMALGEASNSANVSSGSDYSTTNNQVFGVDEADIIKTDGTYIYALVKNELLIINASPAAQTKIVSKITFKSTPTDLFVSGGKLAVFGNDYRMFENAVASSFRRSSNYVFFKVFDISSPTDPKEVRSLNFEGNYTAARLIGNYVYFITNNYAYYSEGEPLTPRILEEGKIISGGCITGENKCFMPDVYYFDAPYQNYNFTSINSINLSDQSEAVGGQVYLVNSAENTYVSSNNIYITNTEYLSEYELEQEIKRENIFAKLDATNQDKIKKIEEVPSFILSKEEKMMKVGSIIDSYFYSLDEEGKKALQTEIDSYLLTKIKEKMKEMEKTIIHKIAIKGGKIEYQAKGEVPGQILNQFSMDENNGALRIATTRNEMWSKLFEDSAKSYSNVYILDESLKTVGALENIATDEKIYSTRFMGDRVYVVTFKRTDPLYVIDLSDQTKPTILGAVKIPGFSTYLHPIDSKGTRLLGFGRDAEELADGGVKIKGLKLSLFDFSDLSKPKELSSYVIGDDNSNSLAANDHRAFLYSADKNIISVPAVLYDNNKLSFSGSLVFSIDNDQLKLKGKVDHLTTAAANSDRGYYYNNNVVRRSLYIENNLFTISDKYLKVNSLLDLSSILSVVLTPGEEDYIITPVIEPTTPMPISTPELLPDVMQTPAVPPLAPPETSSGSPLITNP
jgi:uncharacterized secreted protein with C-terminal beta-propeller domain